MSDELYIRLKQLMQQLSEEDLTKLLEYAKALLEKQ